MRTLIVVGCLSALLAEPVLARGVEAQAAPPFATASDVVVTGRRTQLSNWREAETQHVVVLSDGGERELIKIAHDLERQFFLLSLLLNRVHKLDDTIKLRVTLIGDTAEFQAMSLRNLRWQQGPFNQAFDLGRYYDPREDGAVMASTRVDQKAVLERGLSLGFALQGLNLPDSSPVTPGALSQTSAVLFGLASEPDLVPPVNEQSFALPAQGMIQAGFAQHYLQTFFPAAYPRWYLDGFGQIFSTMTSRGNGMVEYGRAPAGSSAVLRKFGSYPISDVLSGRYLTEPASRTRWTPVHAWMVTHFLLFSATRSGQLRQYLKAIASGTPSDQAAQVFGDQAVLAAELKAYFRAKKPYERVTFPADRATAPDVRRLTVGQAAFVKGRLELGSRVELPPAPPTSADPTLAAQMTAARARALGERDRWLARLRKDAGRFAGDPGAQLLLAEAECRSGNNANCAAAADRALALEPANGFALTWKGMAMSRAAIAGVPEARLTGLRAARAMIARANRADTEAVIPLIAYHRSYAEAGEATPDIAVDGLFKALSAAPASPSLRLALGTELVARDLEEPARTTLQPVVTGAYDAPEREAARAALAKLAAN